MKREKMPMRDGRISKKHTGSGYDWYEFEICEIELSPHYKIVFTIYEYGDKWWMKFSSHYRSHPKTGKWAETGMEFSMAVDKMSQLKEAVKSLEEGIPNLPLLVMPECPEMN